MNNHKLFQRDLVARKAARSQSRAVNLYARREARKEVIAADDPRLIRLAEINRTIPALTREARDLTRALKKCRFLPATCKHCHASWAPALTPKLRCPKCGAYDWLLIPRSYSEAARNPPSLAINDRTPTIDVRPIIDEKARELGIDPPPRLALTQQEFVESYIASPPTIDAAMGTNSPLASPPPERPRLPQRSQAEIDADWQAELARTDPLYMPSETDESADYYATMRRLTETGRA